MFCLFNYNAELLIKKSFKNCKKFGGEYLRNNIDYHLLKKGICISYNENLFK